MIVLAVILALVLCLAVFLIVLYNSMVRGRNQADEAWSGINVQLHRRHDLVPNLVGTVKGYAAHEQEVFNAVAEARSAGVRVSGGDVRSVGEAEKGLSLALGRLFAVAEAYPELKASENFTHLQKTLADLENEIQMSRRYYNGTVREQNNRVMQFPGNLVAGLFGFGRLEFFELESEEVKAVPEVSFERK